MIDLIRYRYGGWAWLTSNQATMVAVYEQRYGVSGIA